MMMLMSAGVCCAQDYARDYPQDSLLIRLDQAEAAAQAGLWQQSLQHYSYVINQQDVVPLSTAYWIAQGLFYTKKFHQSQRLFQGYISRMQDSLSLPSVQLSQRLLQRIDEELEKIRNCKLCDLRGYRYIPHQVCGGTGKISKPCHKCLTRRYLICSVCQGQGVVIDADVLGNTYTSCHICHGTGRTQCTICDGAGYLFEKCPRCRGTGEIPSVSQHCNHQPHFTE